jgi:putative ABC transport system permease protein
MNALERFLLSLADNPLRLAAAAAVLVALAAVAYYHKPMLFILKSLARNKVRTALTGLATGLFVLLVTMVWSVLWFLDLATQARSKDLKAIVTERWQIPSQMPFAYAQPLSEGAPRNEGDIRIKPENSMTWQFFGGTLEQEKPTRENMVFFFCMEPSKVMTMMDGIDQFSAADRAKLEAGLKAMEQDPRKVVIGAQRLQAMNKKVGERIRVYSFNYKDIVLDDVEIIGAFPPGQYGQSAVMNRERLNNALDAYKQQNGKAHPMADKTLNLVWLKVPDTAAYNKVAEQVEHSPLFTVPAVKCETASSGVASFLDAYRDLLGIVRWLLVPALMACMALVICAAISISVRERRTEMAVLKVLGYTPRHILGLVLGEALVLGCTAGLLSAGLAYVVFTVLMGGIPVPIAFFPAFQVPVDALAWGLGLGAGTALAGSIIPALIACSVKVSEVFAKVS